MTSRKFKKESGACVKQTFLQVHMPTVCLELRALVWSYSRLLNAWSPRSPRMGESDAITSGNTCGLPKSILLCLLMSAPVPSSFSPRQHPQWRFACIRQIDPAERAPHPLLIPSGARLASQAPREPDRPSSGALPSVCRRDSGAACPGPFLRGSAEPGDFWIVLCVLGAFFTFF